ncbi:tetratricopeptide repeat protein [candidate division KSB1 bacterium]|nr:tetratricopeptide repeat protein [candidate division KSB1 bacterium]
MKKILVILFLYGLLIQSCKMDSERRIKLTDGTFNGLATRKVATIQLAAARKRSIAVIHLTNETNNRALDWLQNGIVEMLGNDLAQSRQFYVVPTSMTQEAMQQLNLTDSDHISRDSAQVAARQLRAYAFIIGRYCMRHDSLVIETELRRTEDNALMGNQSAQGLRLENVFIMVDQLTRALRNDLQQSLRQSANLELETAARPTESIEAYKAYLQGLEYYEMVQFRKALGFFEQSLQLDSTFVAAYYYTALIQSQLNNDLDRARELVARGLRHSEKASLRDRLSLRCLDASLRGDVTQALAYYQEICDFYPEDATAFLNLGTFLYGLQRYEEAIDYLEAAANLNPNYKTAYNMLGYTYAQLYKVDLARKALKTYAKLAKEEPNPYDSLGDILIRFGLVDEALEAYRQAIKNDPTFWASHFNTLIALVEKGKVEEAEISALDLIEKVERNSDKANALIYLAQIQLVKEDKEAALKYFQQSAELDPRSQTALTFIVQLKLDPDNNEARLRQWLQQIKALTPEELANYHQLTIFVALCLENEVLLPELDSLLIECDRLITAPFRKTILAAFRQIVHIYQGKGDFYSLFRLSEENRREALKYMPSIMWEFYWHYFYRALLRSTGDYNEMKEFIVAQRDLSRAVGNIPFDAQYSNILAVIETLSGNRSSAEKIRSHTGLANEKDWRFSGSYPAMQGFYLKFAPEKNLSASASSNGIWRDGFDGLPDGYLNLKAIFEREFGLTGYARLTVHSPKPQPACIRMGSNRPFKLWVNNQPLVTLFQYTQARMDENLFWVKLRAGSNSIVVKVNSLFGPTGFYLRVTDKNGYGLPGIIFGEDETDLLSDASMQ